MNHTGRLDLPASVGYNAKAADHAVNGSESEENGDFSMNADSHRFCIAPMMGWTDRHERSFLRLLSRRALLYTEMLTSGALLHGNADFLLQHHASEHPVAVQLGGSDPAQLAMAAVTAEAAGYDEINLNIGCPSDRVQSGRFGACLMARPALVADSVRAIRNTVTIPVTVKCRIGVDSMDSDPELLSFIDAVAAAGCRRFVVHARIAVLAGLSPKENREVPPLNYERVFLVKQRFPELDIVINGGITSLESAKGLLRRVDGVMVGREVYQNPFLLREVDSLFYGESPCDKSRLDILQAYLPYIQEELRRGTPLHHMTRHILGLFRGVPGGRHFRRHLSEHSPGNGATLNVLLDAMALVA
ncbi:MAG: tRNA dihydrouridine(20/20a) synthase DusA [Pseudohongiellaceae bacterium]